MSAKITSLDEVRKTGQKRPDSSRPAISKPCPQCGAEAAKPHTPFCSRRCAQLDLGAWLNEDYRVPAHEAQEDADLEAMLADADRDPGLK